MKSGIEKLNKQVASFMLLSLALSAPILPEASIANEMTVQTGNYQLMPKYGAPVIPGGTAQGNFSRAISMYAAPQYPIGELKPIDPAPIISMYSVPEIPIKPTNPDILIPIEKEKILKPLPKSKDIDNSLINIEKNMKKMQKNNFDSASFMKKTDVIKKTNDTDKINNIAKNSDKNQNQITSRVQAGEFIYTNYGSYRTIEPLSYSFFK